MNGPERKKRLKGEFGLNDLLPPRPKGISHAIDNQKWQAAYSLGLCSRRLALCRSLLRSWPSLNRATGGPLFDIQVVMQQAIISVHVLSGEIGIVQFEHVKKELLKCHGYWNRCYNEFIRCLLEGDGGHVPPRRGPHSWPNLIPGLLDAHTSSGKWLALGMAFGDYEVALNGDQLAAR